MPASSETRTRWKKKRKREPQVTGRSQPQEDDVDDEEEDEDELEQPQEQFDDDHRNPNSVPDPAPAEYLSGGGTRISDFPAVFKHTVNQAHSSVLSIAELERAIQNGEAKDLQNCVMLENISHGQLQTLSAVPKDSPSLLAAGELERVDSSAATFVVTPPSMMDGRGVVKRFGGDRVHVVPMHADWFSPNTVHRLERQVVPHFFSGKSAENTPEKYMEYRNRIVSKYMENPERRLTLADCQGLVGGIEMDDLTRVVRFLDHWGIINYCASAPNHENLSDGSYLREDSNGEVHVPSAALKSIDSLIQFDKSKCKFEAKDIYPSLLCHADDHDHEEADLDCRIREHLSENRCNYCSRFLPTVYYQSQKVDSVLCVDCFHDGRFVTGHSSLDFVRIDTSRDYGDLDGESWTNQETLLLLEAIEMYNDNWNEIAEHVSTKSKAQCILHFIRLPTEDSPLGKVEVPSMPLSSDRSKKDVCGRSHSSSNGDSAGSCARDSDSESELPFGCSANPVMAQVAFLASVVGPRVAAACAHTSLAVLSEDSQKAFGQMEASNVSKRTDADGVHNSEGYSHGENKNSEDKSEMHGQSNQNGEVTPLSAEKVRAAAKAGLAAAAMKAKLFADHEEREIQRLSANVINHQLKRLELKLKQFAEVETLLMKECEQVERVRHRIASERAHIVSLQFGNSGGAASSLNPSGIANNTVTNRPPVITPQSQSFNSSGYNNNQPIHPQFVGRQPMFGLGPRLPLSALHPSSSTSPNAMFNSPSNAQPSLSRPLLRSVSGASSSLG